MGQQDVWVGKPIAPSTLARLNYKERKDLVVAAINALGPKDDGPFVSDSDFAAAAEARARRSHCSPEHAVLFETLKRVAAPCEETRRFLDAVLSGQALSGAEKDRWLARWFMSGAFAGSPGLD
jgi:hypothetical protein